MALHQTFISLNGGRSLIASYSRSAGRSRKWIVFLPESGATFHFATRTELANLVGNRIAREFNFLIINKPGVRSDGTDKVEFEKSFRREKRIDDALLTLKSVIPKNNRIHLVGYSEGAYLAPQIGRLDSRIDSITMIGGGTRGWLKEELSNAKRAEKALFKKMIREIRANRTSPKKWNGFSFATWYTYRGDHTLRALREIRVPTLAILGARDRVIDLRSTLVDLMLVSEYKPIQIHVFGDCGHYFSNHWPHVSQALGRFLANL